MVAVTMVVGVGFLLCFLIFWINGDGGFVVDGYDSPKSRDATVLLDNQNDVVG